MFPPLPPSLPFLLSSLSLSLMSLMPAFLHFIFLLWRWIGFLCSAGPWQIQPDIFELIYPVPTANYLQFHNFQGEETELTSRGSKPTLLLIRSDQPDQGPWCAASSVHCGSSNQRHEGSEPALMTCLVQDWTTIQMFSWAQSFYYDQHTNETYCGNTCANSSMGLVSHS